MQPLNKTNRKSEDVGFLRLSTTPPQEPAGSPITSHDLLNRQEAAAFIGVSDRMLDRWELLRQGPPRLKLGGVIRYRRSSILRWLESREG